MLDGNHELLEDDLWHAMYLGDAHVRHMPSLLVRTREKDGMMIARETILALGCTFLGVVTPAIDGKLVIHQNGMGQKRGAMASIHLNLPRQRNNWFVGYAKGVESNFGSLVPLCESHANYANKRRCSRTKKSWVAALEAWWPTNTISFPHQSTRFNQVSFKPTPSLIWVINRILIFGGDDMIVVGRVARRLGLRSSKVSAHRPMPAHLVTVPAVGRTHYTMAVGGQEPGRLPEIAFMLNEWMSDSFHECWLFPFPEYMTCYRVRCVGIKSFG